MELWIRSQDKTFLRKVNTIGIVEGRDFWTISENLTIDFGKYKTKERALEVLDEIENILNDGYVLGKEKYDETSGCYYEPQNNVYEMPKE